MFKIVLKLAEGRYEYYLASVLTGKVVFIGDDGKSNVLSPLASWIIQSLMLRHPEWCLVL